MTEIAASHDLIITGLGLGFGLTTRIGGPDLGQVRVAISPQGQLFPGEWGKTWTKHSVAQARNSLEAVLIDTIGPN